MSDSSESGQLKIQGHDKIHTATEILGDLQKSLCELDICNDSQEVQIKTKNAADQKESNELESQTNVQTLSDEKCIQDENAGATTNGDPESDDELTCDNETFGDVLTKIKAFVDKSKQEEIEKSILIDEWQIFYDFLNLVEKHETNLTEEDLSIIQRGLKRFLNAVYCFDLHNMSDTDLSYAKEIYYKYFSLINLSVIQNYLKRVQVSNDLEIIYRPCTSRILYVMISTSGAIDLGLNDLQRPINCIELLSLMLNYVKTDLKSSDLTLSPSEADASCIRDQILGVIWNYADKTVMVPDLIEVGCLEIMIDGLSMICETANVYYDLKKRLTLIIYNSSRHDDGIKQLNVLNTADLIKAFQSTNEDTDLNTMCCMILALLSTPEQIKNDRKRMNNVLDTLLKIVYDASVSSNFETFRGTISTTNFHISEPLIVFVKLFNNDCTLDYIMEHSTVDFHTSSSVEFFINLLINYHSMVNKEDRLKHVTCTALVNILWSISFQERYKQKLKSADTKLKELIQTLAKEPNEKILTNQYVPQYIENIQKAAESLLFNIDESMHAATEQTNDALTTISDNKQKPIIMFSYSHKDIDFCRQLYDEILKRKYDIWVDFNFIKSGDQWEHIALGMRQANVILCLMSEEYFRSNSCRQEAMFALERLKPRKKPIIPVYLEKPDLPDWYDIRSIDLQYVRFSDSKQLETNTLLKLIDKIEHCLPEGVPHSDLSVFSPVFPIHHEPEPIPVKEDNQLTSTNNVFLPVHHNQPVQTKPTVTRLQSQDISLKSGSALCTMTKESLYPEKSIEHWNKNDIAQWFQDNGIRSELRDLCCFEDGYELLGYRKIFIGMEKLQYQMYSDELFRTDGITSGKRPLLLHEFTKFSNALRKL